jgi:hypothetical protein
MVYLKFVKQAINLLNSTGASKMLMRQIPRIPAIVAPAIGTVVSSIPVGLRIGI